MTDRELMQHALDVLDYEAECGNDDAYHPLRAALRERLAQPEMQPCAGRNCGSTNPNLHSAECFEDYEKATGMAQPEQEPERDEPPPQRKPLTQDETMEIANQTAGQYWMDEAHIQRFRAAVEAAHDIKENA